MNRKKVLIFGGNGLVGSSSSRIFSESDNYEVFSSTRKDTDLFNFKDTQKTITAFNPDIIINCAAKVGGILANNNLRTEFILENLKININIFEACINNPNITIINLGSSCIYPLNAPNPIKESSFMEGKLEETNSPYAMAKLSAIEIGRSLNKQYGHKVLNLMPTNLYGPNDNFDESSSHVIPGLIRRMYSAKLEEASVFNVWGDGTPLREFLYVDDLSNAIKFVIENDINEDLLNIGFGEEISIKELALKIKKIINFTGDIEFDKTKPNGNPRKLLDTTLIRNYGWQPEFSLDKGLELSFNWFTQNLS
jgi:GDP-L-fucose synthase